MKQIFYVILQHCMLAILLNFRTYLVGVFNLEIMYMQYHNKIVQ